MFGGRGDVKCRGGKKTRRGGGGNETYVLETCEVWNNGNELKDVKGERESGEDVVIVGPCVDGSGRTTKTAPTCLLPVRKLLCDSWDAAQPSLPPRALPRRRVRSSVDPAQRRRLRCLVLSRRGGGAVAVVLLLVSLVLALALALALRLCLCPSLALL